MLHQDHTKPSNDHKPEVADIFRLYSEDYLETHSLSFEQNKVMQQIVLCRTSAMGGHIHRCNECGYKQNVYNSCRNRHCPKCQTMAKEKWLNDRKTELLPTGYFHFVFTLPHELNPVILCNKKDLLKILFQVVNETLQAFAKDHGIDLGLFLVVYDERNSVLCQPERTIPGYPTFSKGPVDRYRDALTPECGKTFGLLSIQEIMDSFRSEFGDNPPEWLVRLGERYRW